MTTHRHHRSPCCRNAPVVVLNGAVGAGKSTVGEALARLLPTANVLDGDRYAGPCDLPNPTRWRMAVDALIHEVARPGRAALVIAYPLAAGDHRRLRAACTKARRSLAVINLATPLPMILRGRGERVLSPEEQARTRAMYAQGYHRRPFATATLPNLYGRPERTARRIARLLRLFSR